jgi:Uma2 family endonuclease
MATVEVENRERCPVVIEEEVRIPGWVADLEAFRRWSCSEDYPDHGWFSYLNGELWVDLSMEEMNHNQVKGVFAIVMGGLVLTAQLGRYFHDRMRLSNLAAGLATEPDGTFVSKRSLRLGRVRLVEGEGESPVLIEGSPDMALEVVSPRSVHKDTVQLLELYWPAGIREYWLVDPRLEKAAFDIFRHTSKGYAPTRKRAGWVKSVVFGKSFKLTQEKDWQGYAEYRLAVR